MPQAKFQINHYQKFKLAAIFSCAAVFVGGVYFFQPFSLSEDTNATTETTQNGDYYIETTTTDLNLSINTTPASTQETASHDVIVKTDDPAGFTLTVSVNNDTSNALNLNGSTSATEKFAATSGTYASPKALDDNTWGFADTLTKKNNDQWAAVPLLSSAQQIKQTSSASPSGDTTTVHYGIKAKYDGAHSNGNYSNVITYSVVGNTPPVTYMQDFNTTKCNALTQWTGSTAGDTVTLTDKRDNNEYQVRRLADGHCWMVQNLKLGGTSKMTLYNTDTDITASSWELPASISSGFNSYTTTQMHVGASGDSGWTAIYGNYYNWAAATAGTNPSSGDASASICPKGWKLPKNSGDYSWYYLYNTGYSGNQANFRTATNTGTGYWSGYYYAGSLGNAGSDGAWWSRTAFSGNGAYYLSTDSSSVGPQNTNAKFTGFSVRCVLSST